MMDCWKKVPEERPLFNDLADTISYMMEADVVQRYIDMNEKFSNGSVEKRLKPEERETAV